MGRQECGSLCGEVWMVGLFGSWVYVVLYDGVVCSSLGDELEYGGRRLFL